MPVVGAQVGDDVAAALAKIARDEDRTVSQVIRRAIERDLRERGMLDPKSDAEVASV